MEDIKVISHIVVDDSNRNKFLRKGFIGKPDNALYWIYDEQRKHTLDSFIFDMMLIAKEFGAHSVEIRPWPDDDKDLVAYNYFGGNYDFEERRYTLPPEFKFFWEKPNLEPPVYISPQELFQNPKYEKMPNGYEQQLLF